MNKVWDHNKFESDIYKLWEKGKYFKPEINPKGKPYTILMPPPNANASLHAGHAMYTVDDILIRTKRMMGYSSQWIPGIDHAGFETQYVYEKILSKKGKSRLDFDRDTLYKNIFVFVKKNSGLVYSQMKRLGFSANWQKSVFTLDNHVVKRIYRTFKKMEREGYVYRDNYIVNYCTKCGTSLAEVEIKHVERTDPLYYIKYPLEKKTITVATVRPETMLGDTAVAVNPKDKRYIKLVGKNIRLPLTSRRIPVIEDEMVDMDFGTGAVKITPAHDPNDFETGKKHNLKSIRVIDCFGRIMLPKDSQEKDLDGMGVKRVRKEIVARLQKAGFIEKIDDEYVHTVTTCYKCGRDLEPTITPNWFIKVENLKKPVIEAVKKDRINFHPKKYKKHMLTWLEIMHDWPISRQIAWGLRIPVWYNVEKNPKLNVTFIKNGKTHTGIISDFAGKYSFNEIEKGLQSLIAPKGSTYTISQGKPEGRCLQETDTFDTWFSSGQWPLVTIQKTNYKKLLPTDVMGTLSDILKFWISRMIMFTLYLENKIPFEDVYLWSMVADKHGTKMSKSKGNVVNPIELVERYGADALRFSLIYGVPAGSKAIFSDDKVRGMRNFANKIWNIARFVTMEKSKLPFEGELNPKVILEKEDKGILRKLKETTDFVTNSLENYKFNEAAEKLYNFIWYDFANVYLEKSKQRRSQAQPILEHILFTNLKLLHPFMPFVTEAIWQETKEFRKDKSPLIIASWPGY